MPYLNSIFKTQTARQRKTEIGILQYMIQPTEELCLRYCQAMKQQSTDSLLLRKGFESQWRKESGHRGKHVAWGTGLCLFPGRHRQMYT